MYLEVEENYQGIGYQCCMKKKILVGFVFPHFGIII